MSGKRSLLDNSQCSDDGSLYAKSVSGGVSGSATNSAGDSVDFDSIVSTHCLQEITVIAFSSKYLCTNIFNETIFLISFRDYTLSVLL